MIPLHYFVWDDHADFLITLTQEVFCEEVFCEEDEQSVRRALACFKVGDFSFSDAWEIDGRAYTFHFLWCLHAIVWAIQRYDELKNLTVKEQTTA